MYHAIVPWDLTLCTTPLKYAVDVTDHTLFLTQYTVCDRLGIMLLSVRLSVTLFQK